MTPNDAVEVFKAQWPECDPTSGLAIHRARWEGFLHGWVMRMSAIIDAESAERAAATEPDETLGARLTDDTIAAMAKAYEAARCNWWNAASSRRDLPWEESVPLARKAGADAARAVLLSALPPPATPGEE